MGDSGWTTRKYYHPFKAFIIIHNFSKFSQGNSNNLHRIIVDDFTDSMTYLLMASHFNTDVVNRAGFSKLFMDHSDKMWARGKDMMKYVLKRGGKMGTSFQVSFFTCPDYR